MFVAPQTLQEAEIRKQTMIETIQSIQVQLATRRCLDGQTDKFEDWQRKAAHKLTISQGELARLTDWIRRYGPNQVQTVQPIRPDQDSRAVHLLRSCVSLLEGLIEDGVDLDQDEVAIVDAAREFVGGGHQTARAS